MGKVIVNIDWDDNYMASPKNENIACVVTGRDLNETKQKMTEALDFHIEGMIEDGLEIPEELVGEREIEWHLSTRALLRYLEGVVPRKAISKATGINVQQLTHYASGWRNPRPEMQRRILDGVHKIGQELVGIS